MPPSVARGVGTLCLHGVALFAILLPASLNAQVPVSAGLRAGAVTAATADEAEKIVREFVCPRRAPRGFDVHAAVKLPLAGLAGAWKLLDEDTSDRCWRFALYTVGLIGSPADVPRLVHYLTLADHRPTLGRLTTYSTALTAIASLVARDEDLYRAGIWFLRDCSSPEFWAQYQDRLSYSPENAALGGIGPRLTKRCAGLSTGRRPLPILMLE